MEILFSDVAIDAASGFYSGWVGAGLLGAVLYWIAFHHLPAKDKQVERKDAQIEAVIMAFTEERERDRKSVAAERAEDRDSRHKTAGLFQTALAENSRQHAKAIEDQTKRLEHAIEKSCQFKPLHT